MGKKISVVLFEPEYDENLGYVARAMANFSLNKLILVNPKADYKSDLARSRAMHGYEVLKNAVICNTLEEALSKADFSIATSAKLSQDRKIKRVALSVEECARKFSSSKSRIAIVFGTEKSGLSNKEISICDLLMHIPASREYPTLNLAHAVVVTLYEFTKDRKVKVSGIPARKITTKVLLDYFAKLIDSGYGIKNKEGTYKSFKSLVSRALLTEKEANSVIAVFSGVMKRLKRRER